MENFREFMNEVDGDGPLGKYVFPDEKLKPSSAAATEEYTDLEKHLEDLLEKHYESGTTSLPRNATEVILDMIKNQNYPKIFQLRKSGKMYRGLGMDKEIFEKLFGEIPTKKKWYQAPVDWWHDRSKKSGVNFPFSPKTKPDYSPGRDSHAGSWASSWAWDLKPAQRFMGGLPWEEKVAVILVADASENVFIDSEPLYKNFDFARGFQEEKEAIGVGDIKLTDIYIYYNPRKTQGLKENKEPIPLPDVGDIALLHSPEEDNHELILYTMTARGPFPFAACGLDRLSEVTKEQQCIPETWHMSWIYTHKLFRGSGWSKILYGISFNLINKQGAGLTSDHWSSTSDEAKDRVWNKMISRKQLIPRKTPGTPPTGGHSEFDYGDPGFKKTPLDPLDDCREPGAGEAAATTNSWIMKGHSKFEPIYQSLVENHENLMSAVSDRVGIEAKLMNDATVEFDRAYMGR